ncbi:hypothetical protein BDY24DRAFT_115519 [Mrakia frigida]|uniref:uncharacterized protein n=1 Tax=Mrakia frigida TaxID=29902 RepID=UPI003FCBF6ED
MAPLPPSSSSSSQLKWEPEWGWFRVRVWENYPSKGDMFKLNGEGQPPPFLQQRNPDREYWEDYINFGMSADGSGSYISSQSRPMLPIYPPTSTQQKCLRRVRTSLLLRIDELCRGHRIKDSVREEGNPKQAGYFAPGDRQDVLFYGNLLRKSVDHPKEVLDEAVAAVEGTERRRSEWDQKKLDFYRNHFGVMTQIGSFGGPITFALLFADSAYNDPSLPYRIILAWASCCFFGGLAVAAGCQITTSSLGSGEWVLEDHEPDGMRGLKLKGSLEDHGEGSRARVLGDICGMLNLMGVVLLVSTMVIYLDWAGRLAGVTLLVGLFTSLLFSSRTIFLAHRRWFQYLYRLRREVDLAALRLRHWISPVTPYSRRIRDLRGGWVFVDRWDGWKVRDWVAQVEKGRRRQRGSEVGQKSSTSNEEHRTTSPVASPSSRPLPVQDAAVAPPSSLPPPELSFKQDSNTGSPTSLPDQLSFDLPGSHTSVSAYRPSSLTITSSPKTFLPSPPPNPASSPSNPPPISTNKSSHLRGSPSVPSPTESREAEPDGETTTVPSDGLREDAEAGRIGGGAGRLIWREPSGIGRKRRG